MAKPVPAEKKACSPKEEKVAPVLRNKNHPVPVAMKLRPAKRKRVNPCWKSVLNMAIQINEKKYDC